MKHAFDDDDIERLVDFESRILELDGNIKYRQDFDIEKIVRLEYLVERYGEKVYKFVMGKLEYTVDDLVIEEKYLEIQEEAELAYGSEL
jgi:hypothetical protein